VTACLVKLYDEKKMIKDASSSLKAYVSHCSEKARIECHPWSAFLNLQHPDPHKNTGIPNDSYTSIFVVTEHSTNALETGHETVLQART